MDSLVSKNLRISSGKSINASRSKLTNDLLNSRAMKEIDGRYVGSRPIKLRKSTWRNRGLDERRKKEAEKKALLALINKT